MTFESKEGVVRLLGPRDSFLRQVRGAFGVKVVARGHELSLEGPAAEVAGCEQVLWAMRERLAEEEPLTPAVVAQLIESYRGPGRETGAARLRLEGFLAGRTTQPKTPGQGLGFFRL